MVVMLTQILLDLQSMVQLSLTVRAGLLGSMTWDSAKSKLTRNNIAGHYRTGDFLLNTMSLILGTEFEASMYQKEIHLDIWVNVAQTLGTSCTHLGITTKYHLDLTASVCTKTNNSSLVGGGHTQPLCPV